MNVVINFYLKCIDAEKIEIKLFGILIISIKDYFIVVSQRIAYV